MVFEFDEMKLLPALSGTWDELVLGRVISTLTSPLAIISKKKKGV